MSAKHLGEALEEILREAADAAVEKAVEGFDFEDAIESAAENYDFDPAIDRALERYDFDDAVSEAVRNYDMTDEVRESLAENAETIEAHVRDTATDFAHGPAFRDVIADAVRDEIEKLMAAGVIAAPPVPFRTRVRAAWSRVRDRVRGWFGR